MEKETKEIIKLSAVELLAFLENKLDTLCVGFDDVFSRDHGYSRRRSGYVGPREVDWQAFKQKIYRLKQRGLIRKIFENKRYYLEITAEGKDYLQKRVPQSLIVPRPERWDKKWRIVIYDIPEDDRETRNAIREALYSLGFQQIQKSVFVYPFECGREINLICRRYGERDCIKYMIADIFEGEESITEKFLDSKVLRSTDLEQPTKVEKASRL